MQFPVLVLHRHTISVEHCFIFPEPWRAQAQPIRLKRHEVSCDRLRESLECQCDPCFVCDCRLVVARYEDNVPWLLLFDDCQTELLGCSFRKIGAGRAQ